MKTNATLLMFSVTKLIDMMSKGNIWYVSHYASYFNKVDYLYLLGEPHKKIARQSTTLHSTATGNTLWDLFAMPWRVFRKCKMINPDYVLTADILSSWYAFVLVRFFMRRPLIVMPVCTPDEIYLNSGQTFSGLPKWLEELLILLSFKAADRLVVAENSFATRRWLEASRFAHKTRVLAATPEELPAPEFLDALAATGRAGRGASESGHQLIYVGRLEREKHAQDLVEMAAALRSMGCAFKLTLVGDGSLRSAMEQAVTTANLDDHVCFLGAQPAAEVARLLSTADIFVSTLTGTALKEAGLAGLAVVAYRMDYVADLLRDEHDVLFAERDRPDQLAAAVARLLREPEMRAKIAANLHIMTRQRWSLEAAQKGLAQMVEGLR